MPGGPLPDPMTVGQVAKVFAVSAVTVANWADEGKLPCFRTPGGHRRFHRADVERLVNAGDRAIDAEAVGA